MSICMHIYAHIYIYIYVCVCVCVCVINAQIIFPAVFVIQGGINKDPTVWLDEA